MYGCARPGESRSKPRVWAADPVQLSVGSLGRGWIPMTYCSLSDVSGLHCQPTSKSESRIPARRIKTADVSPACLMGSAYGPGPTWKSREGPIADATSRASPIIGLAPRRSGSGCAMYSISRCSSVGGLQAPPTVELPESWVGPSGCDRLGNEIDLASPGGPDNPRQFVGQSYCGAVMTGTSVEFQGPGS